MQQFILHSQIAPSRHSQVMDILAGVAAMKPVPIAEQHLVYRQLKHVENATGTRKAAPNAQADRSKPLHFRRLAHSIRMFDAQEDTGPWWFMFEDVPEAGKKDIHSRRIDWHEASDAELQQFRSGGDLNKFVEQYIFVGHRFVHGNVVIKIIRYYRVPEGIGVLEPLDAPLPPENELALLDESGTYLLEAWIRTDDASNASLSKKATDELLAFKMEMEGAIDLRVGDRLAMDTRVKGS